MFLLLSSSSSNTRQVPFKHWGKKWEGWDNYWCLIWVNLQGGVQGSEYCHSSTMCLKLLSISVELRSQLHLFCKNLKLLNPLHIKKNKRVSISKSMFLVFPARKASYSLLFWPFEFTDQWNFLQLSRCKLIVSSQTNWLFVIFWIGSKTGPFNTTHYFVWLLYPPFTSSLAWHSLRVDLCDTNGTLKAF